ncbi:MAG: methyltransferase [Oscillospiraceae bacterium]|nr:methyltransferase [Oscillospiraceae bacterium]
MSYEEFGLNRLKLFISEEHRFGTDSLLLGQFAAEKKADIVVDLCSGCGIIPLFMFDKSPPALAYAVELQAKATDLIERTIKANNLGGVFKVIKGDLRDNAVLRQIGRERADLVTANPPYFIRNSGFERDADSQKTARYDTDCTITDIVAAADYLLKFGGCLKMCMTAPRLAECTAIMREYSLEPKKITLIPSKSSKTARLFLISGKKGGKTGVQIEWK